MTAYEKSNRITEVKLSRFSKKEYQSLLNASESTKERQKAAQMLCDYLCSKFNMPKSTVKVVNRSQPHRTGCSGRLQSKTLGTYTVQTQVITLYNLTAIKKHVVSIKVMAATLLHEFIHHYDMTFLKLSDSPHTSGFYKRIADLENKLNREPSGYHNLKWL